MDGLYPRDFASKLLPFYCILQGAADANLRGKAQPMSMTFDKLGVLSEVNQLISIGNFR